MVTKFANKNKTHINLNQRSI